MRIRYNIRFADVFKIGALKNFADFTGKHPCWTPKQVFSCEIFEILENTFFYRTPPVAASVN